MNSPDNFFIYDPSSPLMVEGAGEELDDRGCSIADLTYASPMGGRVPAYVVSPPGTGPFAAVVFMHPGQGNRSTFLSEARSLAPLGVVSVLIDAPFLRPDFSPGARGGELEERAQREADMYRQLVVDLRRAVDLLLSYPEVDPGAIAYVGHSLGATWGGPLAGTERRIGSYVLMAGYPSQTEAYRSNPHPFMRQFRARFEGREELERYLAVLGPLDPVHYIGQAAPAALLFQFARDDEFITQGEAQRYYSAASCPKEVKWYPTDHRFTGCRQAQNDRLSWLTRYLGLPRITPDR